MWIPLQLAIALALAWLGQDKAIAPAHPAPAAVIQDRTHYSEVFGEERNYRVFLPPSYAASQKRYPVIYWFHGFGERYNHPGRESGDYDTGNNGDNIAAYVATHDVIVVKWDGYNPRAPGELNPRPYNVSPVETRRQFPMYFPELMAHIDKTYRTIADRDHRGVTGFSMGGFLSYWVAGKYPNLVSSASAFMPSTEFYAGPRGFDVEYRHEEMAGNYDGVRTRLVMGSRDFIHFYHQRLAAQWKYTRANFETEEFDSPHGTPGIAKTFDFHLRAFASPLPRPAVWSHADVYSDFAVWDWEVQSNRRQPGFTWLENVSRTGFRCSVREWLPSGAAMPGVKLSVISAKLYPPRSVQQVTYIRLSDGQTRHAALRADAEGRLTFDLTGEAYEVGVSPGPVIALGSCDVDGAAWATAGRPVRLKVRFWNKGGGRSTTAAIKWESPNPNVEFTTASTRLFALAPGESAQVPVAFSVADPAREVVRLYAVEGANRMSADVRLFPEAAELEDYRIADGRAVRTYQRATDLVEEPLGEGNADGHAAPGESFALLLPDGDVWRAAELFTNDACLSTAARISDSWSAYDHVGASAKFTVATIRPDCLPGYRIHALARVQVPDKPNHHMRYAAVTIPVWYRNEEKK